MFHPEKKVVVFSRPKKIDDRGEGVYGSPPPKNVEQLIQ
jgi:hypothetical protein